MSVRAAAKRLAPHWAVQARRDRRIARLAQQNRTRSNADIFSDIYATSAWGSAGDYNSGTGSHLADLVDPYVGAVTAFLADLPRRPEMVDLGCGDFNVGAQIRPVCARYVGTDVVPELLERNRALHADVEFVLADLVTDPLPAGDVATLRQVLQHLSNDAIGSVIEKLRQYRYLIVTDHQPQAPFVANRDIPSGPDIRTVLGSGLDLTQPPFDLQCLDRRDICTVPFEGAVIRTTVFRMS